MLFSLLFSSFVFAEEPTDSNRGFEIPASKTGKAVFKSPGFVERPLRPTTHPKDPALSTGTIENFQRLFINERNLKITPNEGTSTNSKLSLPIVNRTTAWVDISISGQKIGRLGPLTTGIIHNVTGGEYDITYTVEHMQYAFIERVKTHKFSNAIAPGNIGADIANADGYKKPYFDDKAATKGGKLSPYLLPVPPAPGKVRIEGNQIVIDEKIFFESGKAIILEDSFALIDAIAEVLHSNPNIIIEISGHTDSAGPDKQNLILSQNRADSVRQYLIEKAGIDMNRLKAVGYGETKKLVNPETTPEDAEKNRRVDFHILEGLDNQEDAPQ